MTFTMHVGGWLMWAGVALPDTVVMRQVVTGPEWVGIVTAIAIGIVALLLIALLAALLPALRELRQLTSKVSALVDRLSGDVGPIVRHATNVAESADQIATTIRTEVQDVSRTVRRANERLDSAITASERRLRELGALLQLVQDEVEQTVVSTTAALRGVRAGASWFRPDIEDDEGDELLEFEDELEEEESEDDDYTSAQQGSGRPPRPRIRSRPR
jgi:uncharacterized protein YoxC